MRTARPCNDVTPQCCCKSISSWRGMQQCYLSQYMLPTSSTASFLSVDNIQSVFIVTKRRGRTVERMFYNWFAPLHWECDDSTCD